MPGFTIRLSLFLPDPVIQDYEATQTFNRYSYCQNNPVNRVDLSGMIDNEWDDDYFNKLGKYLGSDNAKTDKIRIIDEDVYNRVVKKAENSDNPNPEGFKRELLQMYSSLLQDVYFMDISDRTYTGILNHYYREAGYDINEISMPVLIGSRPNHSIWATTMGDLASFMYPGGGWPIPSKYEIPKGYMGIAESMADLANGTMNSKSDVINMFRHERGGHGNQYLSGKPFSERDATLFQVKDASWGNCSDNWKQHMYNTYGKYYFSIHEQQKYFFNYGIK